MTVDLQPDMEGRLAAQLRQSNNVIVNAYKMWRADATLTWSFKKFGNFFKGVVLTSTILIPMGRRMV